MRTKKILFVSIFVLGIVALIAACATQTGDEARSAGSVRIDEDDIGVGPVGRHRPTAVGQARGELLGVHLIAGTAQGEQGYATVSVGGHASRVPTGTDILRSGSCLRARGMDPGT